MTLAVAEYSYSAYFEWSTKAFLVYVLDVITPVNPAVQVHSQVLRGIHRVNILPTDVNWGERFPLPIISPEPSSLFFPH